VFYRNPEKNALDEELEAADAEEAEVSAEPEAAAPPTSNID